MGGMEQESSSLRDQLMTKEAEVLQLHELREEGHAGRERWGSWHIVLILSRNINWALLWTVALSCNRLEELEKENAILKEKIHHLDDMLKSQQRKLRQMIEQVLVHCAHTHTPIQT